MNVKNIEVCKICSAGVHSLFRSFFLSFHFIRSFAFAALSWMSWDLQQDCRYFSDGGSSVLSICYGCRRFVSVVLLPARRRVQANRVLHSPCAPWPARCTLTESGIVVLIYFKLFVWFFGQTTQTFWTYRSSQLLHLKLSWIEFSVVSSYQHVMCVCTLNGPITFLCLAPAVSTRVRDSEPKERIPLKILP